MAQAVAEHVQAAEQEQYEEGVGGPQPLEALAVRVGGSGAGARAPWGAGWQRLTPAAPRCPRRSWACQPLT